MMLSLNCLWRVLHEYVLQNRNLFKYYRRTSHLLMSLQKYLRNAFQNDTPELNQIWRERLIQWRREPTTFRIDYPTRLDRARALGYKGKLGIFLVRQRISKGGHQRPLPRGRKSKNMRVYLALRKSAQLIAEQRANKHYPNCEVLNSYYVGEDGKNQWFEVIIIDRSHPAIIADKNLSWIQHQRGRAYRGLTVAGKRARGMRKKGKGTEKARPSRRAHRRRQ
jgi:large subunit ribosomal protein L15e